LHDFCKDADLLVLQWIGRAGQFNDRSGGLHSGFKKSCTAGRPLNTLRSSGFGKAHQGLGGCFNSAAGEIVAFHHIAPATWTMNAPRRRRGSAFESQHLEDS
jgi:hypothetical protein